MDLHNAVACVADEWNPDDFLLLIALAQKLTQFPAIDSSSYATQTNSP